MKQSDRDRFDELLAQYGHAFAQSLRPETNDNRLRLLRFVSTLIRRGAQ